jgi:hypothetical protein
MFFLLFITQNEEFAAVLCDTSNRAKITALPSAVLNPDAIHPEQFQWKSMMWERPLLTKYLEKLDDGKNPALFEDKND